MTPAKVRAPAPHPVLPAAAPSGVRLAVMLGLLTLLFVLSHAFRTTVAVAADPIRAELGVSAAGLGAVAGGFHLAFALAQPVVGVSLDRYGPKRTVIAAFGLSVAGSAVSALAPGTAALIAGQWLIGFGCAPALLAAMVFVSRRYPPARFAALSGLVLSVGGAGMLLTATPLAWVIEAGSWRTGFWVLGALSALCWAAVALCVEDAPPASPGTDERAGSKGEGEGEGAALLAAVREMAALLGRPQTMGILALSATSYAAFLALRGLWMGPMFAERHGFSVVGIGNVALAVSASAMIGLALFGAADPGGRRRRWLIIASSAAYTVLFAVHAVGTGPWTAVVLVTLNGALAG